MSGEVEGKNNGLELLLYLRKVYVGRTIYPFIVVTPAGKILSGLPTNGIFPNFL